MASRASIFCLVLMAVTDSLAQRSEDVCLLPPEAPPTPGVRCESLIPSFTFSAVRGRCEKFDYGGCFGTGNLFTTLQECQRRCGGSNQGPRLTPPAPSRSPRCSEPPRRGPCQAGPKRFAFSPVSGKCRRLPLGACDNENDNKFSTLTECRRVCAPPLAVGRQGAI